MLLIKNTSTNPYFNLAAEEYFLDHVEDEILLLWRNDRTVVVGRNQNAIEEINLDYVKENDISVVRRLTGGGTVFHDIGNINYTIIQKYDSSLFSDYEFFTKPICEFLKTLGVNAVLSGRNDLFIDGKKFCGNAQARRNGKIMHHGCILFSADVADLTGCLKPNPFKIESKGVKSVRSYVTNISEHLKEPMDADTFFNQIYHYFKENISEIKEGSLNENDIYAINSLAKKKYETWDWNFGQSPDYTAKKSCKYEFGVVEVCFSVEDGIIQKMKIYGDFFGTKDISQLEMQCLGVLHEKEALQNVLNNFPIGGCIWGINAKQFLELLF